MSPLPPEIIAKWLPRWRSLAESAQAAARSPEIEARAEQAMALADSASAQLGGWPSPFGDKRDQYVGAALIWTAKAYGRQGSAEMRVTLAPALEQLALAFLARLERATSKIEASAAAEQTPTPVIPFRRRRADIDDGED